MAIAPDPERVQFSCSRSAFDMAEAPAGDAVLTPKDAVKVAEELLPAQNKSFELGLRLNLPPHKVESIHKMYSDPQIRLLHILIEFLNQAEPSPTWRVIVDALKSPLVNFPQLGREVEAAHFPDSTSTRVSEATVPSSQSPVLPSTSPQPFVPYTSPQPVRPTSHDSAAATGASPTDFYHQLDHPQSTAAGESETEVVHRPASPQPIAAGESETEVKCRPESPEPSPMTSFYIQAKIRKFEKRFKELKNSTRAGLQRRKISVQQIVDAFTSMPADDIEEHKQFLKENLTDLYESSNVTELIGKCTLHWDYLSYQMLEYLMKEFGLEVGREMEVYKQDLQRFRQKTPLALFCQSQKRRRRKPSEEFHEMVAEFDWPHEVTLEVVEQFRQEYAYHYNLRECGMMLAAIRPCSFIITWFIPESIIEKLKGNPPNHILKSFFVTSLQIAGVTVYPVPQKSATVPVPDPEPSAEGSSDSADGAPPQPKRRMFSISPYEDYPFTETPSEDFFCPVTLGLLLQPHLTSCCGKHLSEESAARIQGEGGPCPLCKSPDWSTVLDKHVRRQVREVCVFCHHKEKGCRWKGELSDFEHHIRSCPLRFVKDGPQGRTELHDAAKRGDVGAVQRLLSTSVNINSRTEDGGDTALLLASYHGHVEVVRLLVTAQAVVNIADKGGRTPLFWASLKGHRAVVELLLGNGADVSICKKDGVSPVYVASHEGHTDVVDVLVKAGADVNQAVTIEPFPSPLGIAADKGHTEIVQRLLMAGANPNYQDKNGRTPLYWASLKGHRAVVELLLGNGADVSICKKNGASPVYAASHEGHTDVVDVLVKAGADVNQAVTIEPFTSPLGIAADKGHTEIVQRLLMAGANPNYQDKNGRTPLYLASLKGDRAVVELLLGNGADVSICKKNGASPVYVASQEGHTDVVDVLVKEGADVNQAVTIEPFTSPLGIAADKGHTETVQRLLMAGANPNYQDKNGGTPLYLASLKGHRAVVELLLGNGTDVSICMKNGASPVSVASQEGHTDVVDVLVKAGADVNQAVTIEPFDSPLEIAAGKGHTETVQRLLMAGANPNYQDKDGCTALLYAGWKGHSEVVELLLGAGARDFPNQSGNTALSLARDNNHHDVVECIMRHQQK